MRHPLQKTENGFVAISWEKSFDITAKKIINIQKKHGHDAVGVFWVIPSTQYGKSIIP